MADNNDASIHIFDNISKEDILKIIKKEYLDRIEYIGAEKEKNIFVWKNNHINISIIMISEDSTKTNNKFISLLFYAKISNSESDSIRILNLLNETNNFNFTHDLNFNGKLAVSRLIQSKILKEDSKNIISTSIYFHPLVLRKVEVTSNIFEIFGSNFANNEYKAVNSSLNKTSLEHFNNQLFFANEFQFNNIIKTINDDQFSKELNECLWAYNHEKWFICAAGIGSIIEHLMMLIILNYNNKSMLKALGKTPTARNYINAFKMNPLSITVRQEIYIRTLFQLRNCIDHYNIGYTNKGLVDTLLSGIRTIFDNYYINSLEYKKEHENNKKG